MILSYYFPPLGMGGTQRIAKFVKYLPQFSWQPVVVTVKDVVYYARDETLLQDVAQARCYRTGSLDPQRLAAILFPAKGASNRPNQTAAPRRWQRLNKILAWCFIPDPKVLWLPFALLKSLRLIRREEIACILTTSPPHSVHLAGRLLKKITKLAWVADFRDGWIGGNFQYEPTRLHRWLNQHLEKKILTSADQIVGVSEGLVEELQAHPNRARPGFHVITNGFDLEDLHQLPQPMVNDKFTLTYCGAVTAISPLASFVKSLANLLHTYPAMRHQIGVSIVGVDLTGELAELLRRYEVADVVILLGYQTHLRALEQVVHADLLLYPVASWANRDFVPGKTFEYLLSGNPVLAIGPVVEGVEILKTATRVECVDHSNPKQIEQIVLHYYELYQQGALPKRKGHLPLAYERKQQAQKLAEILNRSI